MRHLATVEDDNSQLIINLNQPLLLDTRNIKREKKREKNDRTREMK